MSLPIAKFLFGAVPTISIPTDGILIILVLSVFIFLLYAFNNFFENQTNNLSQKINQNSNIALIKDKLENQLTIQSETTNQIKSKNKNFEDKNFISPTKILKISGLALLAIAGTSFYSLQTTQKSFKKVNTSQVNIISKNKSLQTRLSITPEKTINSSQPKINYVNAYLSNIKNNKYKHYYLVKTKDIEQYFAF